MKYEKANEKILQALPKDNAQVFRLFIEYVEKNTEYYVLLTDGSRTYQEQAALHAENPKNAKPGTSRHESGRAIDCNLIGKNTGTYIRKKNSLETWEKTGVPQIAREVFGMKWGGDYKKYHDPVHFELPTGTSALLKKVQQTISGGGLPLVLVALFLTLLIIYTISA